MISAEGDHVHAPTLTVSFLRAAAAIVEAAAEQLPGETVYFSPKEEGEPQPIVLAGHIGLTEIGGLIRYLADMLEA